MLDKTEKMQVLSLIAEVFRDLERPIPGMGPEEDHLLAKYSRCIYKTALDKEATDAQPD